MSDSRLLPTGSSPLEVAAAKACAEIEKTPVSIRELWNPDTCPANLLPWLAWAFSVDRWDEKWPEATKRAVIRDAYFIHCHKGTIGATVPALMTRCSSLKTTPAPRRCWPTRWLRRTCGRWTSPSLQR